MIVESLTSRNYWIVALNTRFAVFMHFVFKNNHSTADILII